MDTYAPAAVLINRKHECLYSLGPTDRYLQVASGAPVARSARHGASGHAYQAAVGDPAGQPGERASRRRRRPDERRRPLRIRSTSTFSRSRTRARSCCWSASSTRRRTTAERDHPAAPGDGSRVADARAGARGHQNGTAGRHPQPGDVERRPEGDQRRGAVHQRGISIHQRGAADVQGGAAVAQRGADRPQQPAPGNAGAAAHDVQRSAEHPLQHRCRDDLPRPRPQHPLLHAGHQVAVQRHSRRRRAAARRPQLAGRRRRPC